MAVETKCIKSKSNILSNIHQMHMQLSAPVSPDDIQTIYCMYTVCNKNAASSLTSLTAASFDIYMYERKVCALYFFLPKPTLDYSLIGTKKLINSSTGDF